MGNAVQDCDLLGGFNGDGDQCAIGIEELVDLLGHTHNHKACFAKVEISGHGVFTANSPRSGFLEQ